MVLKCGNSKLLLVILAVVLFMLDSAEPKQQIRRLVEERTVDDGVVKARIVAEYKPTESEKKRITGKKGEEKKEYVDDDEDSMDSSSGDSSRGESYEMDMANDEPMPSSNQSSSESSGQPYKSFTNNDNSTSKPVTSSVELQISTVATTTTQSTAAAPTAIRISATNTTVPQTTRPPTTRVSQTTKPRPSTNATITRTKDNVTSTLSPVTMITKHVQNITILPISKVTETKTDLQSTTRATTTIGTPKTTKIRTTTATNVTTPTHSVTGLNTTNIAINATASTKYDTTSTSSGIDISVRANKDPETKAKRRNTLFGFVTVEILIALLAGALFSVLLVVFLVYRLKKRNEGSYELSETIALRPKEVNEMGKKKEVFV